MTADGVPLASWWWRVLAVLIDSLITTTIVTVITFPVWRSLYATLVSYFNAMLDAQQSGAAAPPPLIATDLISGTSQLIVTSVTLAVGMLYHAGFLRWKSATPGKLICGLRVVPVDRGHDPGPLAWNSIGIRTAVWVLPDISSFLGLVTLVDVLFPLWQPEATGAARHSREDAGRTASLNLSQISSRSQFLRQKARIAKTSTCIWLY